MHEESATLAKLLESIPEPFRAAILATVVALLRILYDGRVHRMRRFLEAMLCGAIALGVAHLVEALGMTQGWATFLGASIGLFGVDQVREWGRRIAERRVR